MNIQAMLKGSLETFPDQTSSGWCAAKPDTSCQSVFRFQECICIPDGFRGPVEFSLQHKVKTNTF
uniref:Uncharacterized protein n=1 Tax=Anguilla anguilla TaxID=7936 RepID=A0A0E9XC31_ANGAN